jgi:hypothetical protein
MCIPLFTEQYPDSGTNIQYRYHTNAAITEEIMLALADKMAGAATQFSNSMQGYDEFILARDAFASINHQLFSFAGKRSNFVVHPGAVSNALALVN